MQRVSTVLAGEVQQLALPDAQETVMPGVPWGAFDHLFTPAYWASQLWMLSDDPSALTYKLGTTLKEETAACLLGGHGITAEMCLAAYDALRACGLLARDAVTQEEIASVLKEKLSFGARSFRYRFPNKKAEFLAPVLNTLSWETPPLADHRSFRNWFLRFAGVGLKTASWITRNWLNSASVAILDIHVVRCGRLCGLFRRDQDPARHYCQMEELFLDFARRIRADAAKLDVLMWQQMRNASSIGLPMLAAAN
ncbi:MAG: 8-oxoguanine DNA glycosylase [Limisphaerales bacterium]